MAHHQHRSATVNLANLEEGLDDPFLHLPHALAAGHRSDAAASAPQFPTLIGPDRVKGQTCPFTKIEFEQILPASHREIEPPREDLGRLSSALQWARVKRLDLFLGQAVGDRRDLGTA